MIVVFLGPPGSGKGTQAALLASRWGMVHLSTGDLLRAACASDTPLGRQVASYLDEGRLVPDEVVTGLVAEKVGPGDASYLLDGFPRTIAQADDLGRLCQETGQVLAAVVLFEVPEDELVRRLVGRGRSDDDPETIRRRLRVYEEETSPLIAYYERRGLLRRVEGVGGIEEIHERVVHALPKPE